MKSPFSKWFEAFLFSVLCKQTEAASNMSLENVRECMCLQLLNKIKYNIARLKKEAITDKEKSVKFSTAVSSQHQSNAVPFHPRQRGMVRDRISKEKQMRALQTSHTHMHMYTHSMQRPPQANTTTQHWHKAQVDATKCSEELQYQHESW